MALLLRNGRMPQIRPRPTKFEQGRSITVPAPYGGLNLRDDITSLKPNEARVLYNWFPGSGECRMRDGFAAHGTGVGSGEVKTLASFNGLTVARLVAGSGTKLYNVTSAGAGTEIGTGFSEARWQTECYNNHIFLVNGTDAPQDWDGTTLTSTLWTGSGLTITNLVNIALVRNRLWFCENNKAHVWYGGIGSVTGALTKFQLEQIASGGTCQAVGSWSRDAGAGADDVTVFVMSTGEIIIYEGDPATTFTLIGKYAGAPPIGRHCIFKVGGESIVITRLGLLPISAAIGGVALDLSRIDPWGKIAGAIVVEAVLHGSDAGWSGTLHEGVVYINVPQTVGSTSTQYVLNTRTGSWTTFRAWNCSSLASFSNSLYFGAQATGLVRLVGGTSDAGSDITAFGSCAFVTPSNTFQTNMFTAIRPKVDAAGTVSGSVGVDTDFAFRSQSLQSVPIIDDTSETPWGSEWGSPWGSEGVADPTWFSIEGDGRSVSVRFRVQGQTQDTRWFATDLLFKPGGIK